MVPLSPESISSGDFQRSSMAGKDEKTNSFTAVNDDSVRSLAVKALDHNDKEWSNSNGDPNAYQPYPATAPKRRFGEMEAGGEEITIRGSATISPGVSGPTTDGAADARSGPPNVAAPREYNLNDQQIANLIQQEDSRPDPLTNGSPQNRMSQSSQEGPSPDQNGAAGDVSVITNAGLQVDMRKRKRAFTNRTKTGCQTCRKRKKKCDEGKPACNNCIRGGFTCLGYMQRKDPAMKNNNLARGITQRIEPAHTPHRDYWTESSSTRTNTPRAPSLDQGGHPMAIQDGRHSGFMDDRPLTSWSSPSYNQSAPRPMGNDRSLPPPPAFSNPREQPIPNMNYAPMAAARKALNHTVSSEPRMDYNPMSNPIDVRPSSVTAEDKQPKFKPTERLMTREREVCRTACGKFNSAMFEGSGDDEIRRRFRLIVIPDPHQGSSPSDRQAAVGKDVWVDAPFSADYGHNLQIGDEVRIESGCKLKDATTIYIGNKTVIGPGVTISTEYAIPDTAWAGWCKKIPVRIGTGCYIGANCTIQAQDKDELVIGNNVYIGAGHTITMDIPAGTVLPARDTRGPMAQPYDSHLSGLMR
ncbi:hypothetical protein BT63DRAFT_136362 [Microthyrium microscopicum]|uniref:Zn(2)-C6 fungal-type domain-containing protein n=1 Tax=Microthyrium microscopicum TaxID=703497 RepID=A0A6A6UMW1_9PEZI|nr:hypothetical protein BT63DRAFT_136362 [Microthyrium microscopicum]